MESLIDVTARQLAKERADAQTGPRRVLAYESDLPGPKPIDRRAAIALVMRQKARTARFQRRAGKVPASGRKGALWR